MTYPPAGTIFVPPELYPPLFRHRDLAAWAVEDQPHFSEAGLGARFRAIHLAEGPIEVVQVSLPSTSPDVRHLLMEEGVNSVTDRSDRSALLEFQDDWMVLVRLSEHPSNPHRSIVAAGTPAFPLPAWPPGKSPSTQALTIEHHTRRVATLHNLPKSPEALDFATLEEALTSARGGGLGAIHTVPADKARRAIEQLEEVVKSFDGAPWTARRERLTAFLEQARESADAREKWEAFLAGHPLFRSTLEAAVAAEKERLRESIRLELLGEEPRLREQIEKLEKDYHEWEGFIASAREEVRQLKLRSDELNAGNAMQVAVQKVEGKQNGHPSSEAPVDVNRSANHMATVPSEPSTPTSESRLPAGRAAISLSTLIEAAKHLEKNLTSLGLLKVSARPLARGPCRGVSRATAAFLRVLGGGDRRSLCCLFDWR